MKIKNLFRWALAISAALTIESCSQDYSEIETPIETEQGSSQMVYKMYWNAPNPGFDDGTTRAVTKSWDNGSVVYLRFKNGTQWIPATATYNAASAIWMINGDYLSSVPTTSSNTECEMYYFLNPSKVENSLVTLTETSAPFKCVGSYTHPSESEFYVTGILEPLVWRLRFQGTSGTQIILSNANDIQYYTSYDAKNGTLASPNKKNVVLSVSNGYTPYIYGTFVNATGNNNIRLENSNFSGYFIRTLSGSKLQVKSSGVMAIPTISDYVGWDYKDIITNCDAEPQNICTFTDGIVMEFKLGSNATNFYYDAYTKEYADSKTDDEIIKELMTNESFTATDAADYSFRSIGEGYKPDTEYYLCTIATNSEGKQGNLTRYKFKTLASNAPIAKISNMKASTKDGSNIWDWKVTLSNGCQSYYIYTAEDANDFDSEEHWRAFYMYYAIQKGYITQTYTYTYPYISRNGSTFYACTWAVDSQGNIGNYSFGKTSATSSVKSSGNGTELKKQRAMMRKKHLSQKVIQVMQYVKN